MNIENTKRPSFLVLAILMGTLILGGCNQKGGKMSDKDFAEKMDKYMEGEEFAEKVEGVLEDYVKEQEEEAKKKQAEANKPKQVDGVSIDDDAVLGDKDAPVTLIEFSDYECPFCKRSFKNTMPKIKEKYIDTGKVKMVFRDFPLGFHKNAIPAAIAAECAGDESDAKYFEMHDALFETDDFSIENMKKLAADIGLNTATFNDCLDSEKHKDEVQADMKDGQSYGVSGTPAFFINGWYIKGAKPYAEFEKLIEQELSK